MNNFQNGNSWLSEVKFLFKLEKKFFNQTYSNHLFISGEVLSDFNLLILSI